MKSLVKFKMLSIIALGCFLFSCKNNNDGYSDEIETVQTPTDSTNTVPDTTSLDNASNQNEGGDPDDSNTGAASISGNSSDASSKTSEGTGSGPGESAKDGATYTNTKASDSLKKSYKKKK
ncbi:hypothetical protein [Flavobacterium foetidum]|uniref:hypothetical protein n=1 Tax=Flavobacterium foetidum TaxID=2026681 RepID=UPI0010757976|nr:hypothetical protein [Flavobacterium foetidum]KAF2508082.1 hypothetical protein E0W73_19985 [Flavobacterium foetidum]